MALPTLARIEARMAASSSARATAVPVVVAQSSGKIIDTAMTAPQPRSLVSVGFAVSSVPVGHVLRTGRQIRSNMLVHGTAWYVTPRSHVPLQALQTRSDETVQIADMYVPVLQVVLHAVQTRFDVVVHGVV